MWSCVSNTAEYGGRTRGKSIITPEVRENMKEILRDIQTDKFAREWINEYKSGLPNLTRMREEDKELLIEKVGARLRKMFVKK